MKPYAIPAYPSHLARWKRAAEPFTAWVRGAKSVPRRMTGAELAQWRDMTTKRPAPRKSPGSRGVVSAWARLMLNSAAARQLRVAFTESQMPRGGPGRGREFVTDEIRTFFQLRAHESEIKSWIASAESEGLTTAEWCRQVLDWASAHPRETLGLAV